MAEGGGGLGGLILILLILLLLWLASRGEKRPAGRQGTFRVMAVA